MKKSFNALKVISIFAIGFSFFLNSCENFLSGTDITRRLDEEITYANAPSVKVFVTPIENKVSFGNTIPYGETDCKVGYKNDVSFTVNEQFAFISWTYSAKDSNGREITDAVEIESPELLNTNFTVLKEVENISIYPHCIKRPEISGQPTPQYSEAGVSRDRSIVVEFTKPIDASSFIFNEDEIPAVAEPVISEDDNIYAYVLNNQTYYKNISIENSNGVSLSDYFDYPVVDGKRVILTIKRGKQLSVPTTGYEIIKVTIDNGVYDTEHVSLYEKVEWNYKIIEATDEKASIIISSEKNEGSVMFAGTSTYQKDYSLGGSLNLSFIEEPDYQFVRWQFDPSIIRVDYPENANTTAIVIEKTTESAPSFIKAICAPRLKVTKISPDTSEGATAKNSQIDIYFDKNLPVDDESLKQLDNISILIGGETVKNSFLKPTVVDNKITFAPNNLNMISVLGGQNKTVTVSIPAEFYYLLNDDDENPKKITIGGNGYIYNYIIDSSTMDKSQLSFSCTENSGIVTPSSGTTYKYSIGQEVQLNFNLNDGFIFNEWTVLAGGNPVDEDKIYFSDPYSLTPKLYILDAVSDVTVKANCSAKLTANLLYPASTNVTPAVKDSDITISFNKPIASDCDLSKIKISSDISLDSYFEDRTINGKNIVIKNTNYIPVYKGDIKTITIEIPKKDVYYIDSGKKVYLENDLILSYSVNSETDKKAKISFVKIDGNTGNTFAVEENPGTINQEAYKEFSIGDVVSLNFNENQNYQFTNWEVTDHEGNPVSAQLLRFTGAEKKDAEMNILKDMEGVTVKAVCYHRPSVQLNNCEPYSSDSATEYAKNSSISIKFDKPIAAECAAKIKVLYSVKGFEKEAYYKSNLDSSKTLVTLESIEMLPLTKSYETVSVKIPHDEIYYLTDTNTKIYMDASEDVTWSFNVNNKTLTNTTIRFAVDENSDSDTNSITVDGTVLASGNKETFNIQQEVKLQYVLKDGFSFKGWLVKTESSSYTVSSTVYTKSGIITVKIGNESYLDFIIDDENPLKATAIINKAITNGKESYGVSIFACDTLIPDIVSAVPVYDNLGVACDTPIEITFNKDMYKNSVTLGKTGTIQIVDSVNEDIHYESYYNLTWEENNKIILTPDINISSEITSDVLNLKVKIQKNLIKDNASTIKERLALTSKNLSEDSSGYAYWIYRINKDMETTVPEFIACTLSKDTYIGGVKTSGKTTINAYSKNERKTYRENMHINDRVYINVTAKDVNSRLEGLYVRETLIQRGTDSSDLEAPVILAPVKIYDWNNSIIGTASNLEYVLNTKDDGFIQLDIIARDRAGNDGVKTYYVFKDTIMEGSKILSVEHTVTNRVLKEAEKPNRTGSFALYEELPDDTVTEYLRTVSDGMFTVNLDFSSTNDYYYSNYPSSAYVTVEYGTSLNSLNNLPPVEVSTKKYSISCNANENTFVKITAVDDVGNKNSIVRVIPKHTSFAGATFLDNKLYFNCSDYISQNALALEIGADYFDYSLVYTYQETESSTPSRYRCYDNLKRALFNAGLGYFSFSDSLNFYAETFRPDGIYKFYLVPYFMYPGNRVSSGPVSEVYTFYHNVSNTWEEKIPVMPESLTVTVDEAQYNVGYRTAHVTSGSFTPTAGFSYFYYFVESGKTNGYGYSADTTFNLPSCKFYDLGVYATDNNGNERYSDVLKTIDLSEDNKPPYITDTNSLGLLYKSSMVPNYVRLTDKNSWKIMPHDEGVGLLSPEPGKSQLSYYLVRNNIRYLNGTIVPLDIKPEDLSKYEKYTIVFDSNADFVDLPYYNLDEGIYTVVLEMEDNNHNVSYVSFTDINIEKDINQQVNIINSQPENFSIKVDLPDTTHYNYSFGFDRLNNSKWNHFLYIGSSMNNLGTYTAKNLSESSDGQYFYRINTLNCKEGFYYQTAYVYPEYEYTKETANELECNSSNMVQGVNAVQIFYDNPMFVHTLYYPSDLGIKPSNWETKATEINLVEKMDCKTLKSGESASQKSFTYKADMSLIPDGNYYVYIAHFADGNVIMSDVMKK